MEKIKPRYAGDGVYMDFDGFHIILKANDFDRPTDTIYLEPSVLKAINQYHEDILKTLKDGSGDH